MDYVILDHIVIIENEHYSNFIELLEQSNTHVTARVANTQSTFNIAIYNGDMEASVKYFFKQMSEK